MREKSGRKIGYARVSTFDQDPDHQIAVLREAGCVRIYTEYASGTQRSRAELEQALVELKAGDTLVVWKFDRLGRSLQHLIDTVSLLGKRGIQLRSVTEQSTHTRQWGGWSSRLWEQWLSLSGTSYRNARSWPPCGGKKRIKTGAGPALFHDPSNVAIAKALLGNPDVTRADVARHFNMKPASIYKWFPGGEPEAFGTGRYGAGLGRQGSKKSKRQRENSFFCPWFDSEGGVMEPAAGLKYQR